VLILKLAIALVGFGPGFANPKTYQMGTDPRCGDTQTSIMY